MTKKDLKNKKEEIKEQEIQGEKVKKTKTVKITDKASVTPKKAVINSTKEPTTMEELLAMEGNNFRTLKRGSMVDGIVKEVNSNTIFIDVGAKTDGVVLGREFEKEKDFIRRLKPGDIVNAYVGSVEDERGQILLSLRKAASNFAWEKFEEMMKTGETIEIRGREINRGGLIVDAIFGLQGFVPGSQIGSMWQGKLEQLVGRTIITKVIEVNREQNRLVFSEKMVSDAEKIAKTAKAIGKLKLDEDYDAEITQVAPFGLFVKINRESEDIEGLVHISEVSWQKVEDLNTLFKAKDKVKVKVINLDNNRVQFSIKQLLSDPWDQLEEKYPIDSHLTGKVTRLTSFGALVQIQPGIEGLVHISKIPPELPINEGEELETYIESIDKKSRRISLGLVLSQKPIGYK